MIGLSATVGILVPWQIPVVEAIPGHDPLTYVMLLNPDCEWEFRDQFDYYMRLKDSQSDQYIDDNYLVICMGGVNDLKDIESHIVPILRQNDLESLFVFVYPDSMIQQYNDYIEGKYGYQYRYLALGNTDVEKGIAYVNEVPANVKHEMAHLAICGTWHDEQGRDIGQIVKHVEAEQAPWCS